MPPREVACIGSRTLPPDALAVCTDLARTLTTQGWTVVTGAAPGADQAYMRGADPTRLRIVLPWASFEAAVVSAARQAGARVQVLPLDDPRRQAALAEHPAAGRLSPAAQRLLGRDGGILEPDPGQRVTTCIAWPSPRGGGTAFTMGLAQRRGIRVIDLSQPLVRARAVAWLRSASPTPRPHL